MSFFSELKRRNVFRMGIAYVVVAWVLLQAIDFTLDIISAPNWVMQVFLLAGVAGLPIVLIFAWVFELTPEGIKRETQITPDRSITHRTGQKLDRTIIVFLAIAVLLLLGERIFRQEQSPAPESAVNVEAKEQRLSIETDDDLRSVAVLPFVNMSSDPEQEYFSDGLSEELLNRLAQNDQLRVAARTSSFQFKGRNQDIADIGQQLKVDHVLEGSVRKAANRLRVTAQLIQVNSGYHLWSDTYEREIDDIFAIQDDIALAITSALEVELDAVSTAPTTHPTDNLQAYQAYLQARYLLAKRGEANMLEAVDLFERAVELDPGFSKAWSGLAFNLSLLPQYGPTLTPREAWQRIKVASEQAIRFDPGNAEAYAALARINPEDDLNEIENLFEKAYELSPNNADVVNLYADFMMQVGDFEAAERLEKKAIELDPLAAVHYSDIAFVMFAQHRFEEGLEYGRTSSKLESVVGDRADPLVVGLIANGFYDEAIEVIEEFEQRPESDKYLVDWWWCFLYYQQNDEHKLAQKLAGIVENIAAGEGYINYTMIAFFKTWLDGVEAALPFLRKAHESNEYNLLWPEFFYLPEEMSDDSKWLAFWQQPRLAEFIEMRRANKTLENIGWWRAPE